MLVIQTPEGPLDIYFQFSGQKTFCLVFLNGSLFETGKAVCSEEDTFDENVGKKLALTRAIASLRPSYRQKIWNIFLPKIGIHPIEKSIWTPSVTINPKSLSFNMTFRSIYL